ncbi:hypothetical protein BCR42DRAFT_174080 [Absidia repens]|uniref:Karyogamy protein n=1 Tax=Absidia repens TaxID=90262 RepID=A0A1X2HZM4_9FUNG|nr:hypothetical protein BCR42DRAFT_174080 [Absidia repens]
MLTLCELATAQISVPVECQSDHPSNHLPACIKKLATAPQTWTTYSGYYRDVVTICFAIRYPLEKELLLEAQQNMTYYQSRHYDMLQQQQRDLHTWRQQEMKLLNIIRLQQSDLWDEFASLQKTSTNELLDLVTIIKQVKQTTIDVHSIQRSSVDLSQRYFDENVRKWNIAFQAVDHGLNLIYTKMDEILLWQNQTLTMYHHEQELQYQTVQQWQQSIDLANQSFSNLVNLTESHIQLLQEDILDIHAIISTAVKPVRQIFRLILVFWHDDTHLFALIGLLVSCHFFLSYPWCTLGKVLALGN